MEDSVEVEVAHADKLLRRIEHCLKLKKYLIAIKDIGA